ncbi:hypothetical protein LCGC14_2244080, partial [marine sediment metagenome]
TDTRYNYLLSVWTSGWTVTEAQRYQLAQECTFKKLYVLLLGAPGSGKNYTFTVRQEGASPASGLVVVIADAATSGNDTVNTISIADGDSVGIEVNPGSTPATVGAIWGLVCNVAVPPTVTSQAFTAKEDTTATGNGNITFDGGENCDIRGYVWDLASQGAPGNVAPGSSGYANDVAEGGSFGEGAFTSSLTGLPTGDTIYGRAYAHNSKGYAYGAEVNFLTKPAAATNVAATSNQTDKVTVTWTKSTGASGYKVYEGANLLDTLGDVATYDDSAAPAGSIDNAGTATASDGTAVSYVTLSLASESTANGAARTYKVVAFNATGDADDSATDPGNRTVGAITYQWQRSAADSDADYSNISGGTTDPYNDTSAPSNGIGRYFQCILISTDASNTPQTSTSDRGYTEGVTDNISLSDAAVPDRILNPALTDNVALSDTSASQVILVGVLTDNISLSDAASAEVIFTSVVADNIKLSDTLLDNIITTLALTDNISLSDATAVIRVISETLTDNIALSDFALFTLKRIRAMSDFTGRDLSDITLRDLK